MSVSGYYAWRNRPPSPRAIRHAWLTDLITQVHTGSRSTHGARRVHAEPRLGHGVPVSHGAVKLLMRRAGPAGVTGRPRWRRSTPDQIATDLVDRQFSQSAPNQLANAIFEYLEI
ncbi:IS3 family transposase [Streptosporangium sp. G12]